jgi:hypothetical protein
MCLLLIGLIEMDKRYQVFVSSTYADLREERQRVIQALMEMDCIPSGMELFPAADEEQWEFIKRIIDDCDYYLLIIGGRYGSTTPEGISYTEKEYDYAIEKGIKVIALLHANPEEIPMGKSEADPESRGRLKAFRDKVAKNRLVKFWKTADELPGLVALSLSKTIKMYPAVGWIRANQASNTQLLNELNELRKTKDNLENELAKLRKAPVVEIPNLASIDEKIKVSGRYSVYTKGSPNASNYDWSLEITWKDIFALIAPHLLSNPSDNTVKSQLATVLFEKCNEGRHSAYLNDPIYQTIKIQLQALNLVNVQYLKTTAGGWALFWTLTDQGHSLMMSLRTIKSGES